MRKWIVMLKRNILYTEHMCNNALTENNVEHFTLDIRKQERRWKWHYKCATLWETRFRQSVSCSFCDTFTNIFFLEYFQVTASEVYLENFGGVFSSSCSRYFSVSAGRTNSFTQFTLSFSKIIRTGTFQKFSESAAVLITIKERVADIRICDCK